MNIFEYKGERGMKGERERKRERMRVNKWWKAVHKKGRVFDRA